jgi:hypothetical protein
MEDEMKEIVLGPVFNEDGSPSDLTKAMLEGTGREMKPRYGTPAWFDYLRNKYGCLLPNCYYGHARTSPLQSGWKKNHSVNPAAIRDWDPKPSGLRY